VERLIGDRGGKEKKKKKNIIMTRYICFQPVSDQFELQKRSRGEAREGEKKGSAEAGSEPKREKG